MLNDIFVSNELCKAKIKFLEFTKIDLNYSLRTHRKDEMISNLSVQVTMTLREDFKSMYESMPCQSLCQ